MRTLALILVLASILLVEPKWTFYSALEQSIARAEKDAATLIGTQAMSVVKAGGWS
jgi:hypothetical protein